MDNSYKWHIVWDGKYNSGFRGKKQICDVASLIEALEARDQDGDAEFTLYHDGMKHENLTMSVSASRWFLYFFPEDDTVCGFQSLGDNRDDFDTTPMPAGSNIEVCNYTLVEFDVAVKTACEYMETGKMPSCIKWEEL